MNQKERIIYRLPYYPDRIAHHAIMNVVKDIWTKSFIHNTYSCIEGRGIYLWVKLIMLIVEIKLYFILYIDLIIFLLILKLLNMIGVFMLKIEKKKLNLKHNIL